MQKKLLCKVINNFAKLKIIVTGWMNKKSPTNKVAKVNKSCVDLKGPFNKMEGNDDSTALYSWSQSEIRKPISNKAIRWPCFCGRHSPLLQSLDSDLLLSRIQSFIVHTCSFLKHWRKSKNKELTTLCVSSGHLSCLTGRGLLCLTGDFTRCLLCRKEEAH